MSVGKQVVPYRLEYVQGSEDVMECVAMLFLHLYSNSNPFDSRGRRRPGRQELECFERTGASQQRALDAACRAGYGGNLHGGYGLDGGVETNGTVVGQTIWRSSSHAARVECSAGKPTS